MFTHSLVGYLGGRFDDHHMPSPSIAMHPDCHDSPLIANHSHNHCNHHDEWLYNFLSVNSCASRDVAVVDQKI